MSRTNIVRISSLNPLAEDLQTAVHGFLNYCKSKNLSRNTIIYYQFRLQAFQRYIDANHKSTAPKDVTPQIIREFLTCETEGNSPSTATHSYITLRAFFNFLVGDGFLETNPVSNVDKPKRRKEVINTFTLEQIEQVLITCRKDFTGVRDRALILVMLDCGLRVSELCGLRLDDINWTEQTMLVVGKGNKERIVPFGTVTRQSITDYLNRRGEMDTKILFVTVYSEPIDRYRVRRIIQTRCEAAKISGVRCSPHTLRHSMAVAYLRNGGDVFSLQKLLGHSSLDMTRKYAELSQTDVQNKHRQFSPADRLQSAKQSNGRKRLR